MDPYSLLVSIIIFISLLIGILACCSLSKKDSYAGPKNPKISAHISFYWDQKRLIYLNQLIDNMNSYPWTTDIFIHTNKDFNTNYLNSYSNGTVTQVVHNLTGINPFKLTHLHRDLMKEQINEYNFFIYLEDDILIPTAAIHYWIEHSPTLTENNYNLGFIRVENGPLGESSADISENNWLRRTPHNRLKYKKNLAGTDYIINDVNPYCAFWIYDRQELQNFISSHMWNPDNIVFGKPELFIRERAALGHVWKYDDTLIPLINNKLDPRCRVYHLPNNYVDTWGENLILYDDLIDPNTSYSQDKLSLLTQDFKIKNQKTKP